jgi:protein pelota
VEIIWISHDDNRFKVRVERDEDLWYLSHVIQSGDYIEGQTERKVDMGTETKTDTVRKTFFLGVDIESVEYDPELKSFRASGRITKCPEEVSKGRYHTFDVQEGDVITVTTDRLTKADVKKLDEATTPPSSVLLVLVDRDSARFAALTPSGYDVFRVLDGDVEKKAYDQATTEDFHSRVAEHINELCETNFDDVVIASPGFWKENVAESVTTDSVIQATVSRTDDQGFNELVKRPEVDTALSSEKNRREAEIIERLLASLRNEEATYGWEQTVDHILMGAVEELIVSENFLSSKKKDNEYDEVEDVMRRVEEMGGDVAIISSDQAMSRADGLGGIAGRLRWKA